MIAFTATAGIVQQELAAMAGTAASLAVCDIVEDAQNARKEFYDMEQLTQSIAQHGQMEAMVVTQEPSTVDAAGNPGRIMYRLLSGARRLRAAIAARLTHVLVTVRPPMSEKQRQLHGLICNLQRADIPLIDLALALESIMIAEKGIKTREELARAIGKSEGWVSEHMRVLDLPANLIEKLRTSKLPLCPDSMARIARVEDPQKQARLIDAVLAGATNRQIRASIKSGETITVVKRRGSVKSLFKLPGKLTISIQSPVKLSDIQALAALEEAVRRVKNKLLD